MSHTGLAVDDEEELFTSPLLYRLVRTSDGALILEVVVGGMAMSTVRVALNEEEIAAYENEGQSATDALAKDVQSNPSFHGRAVSLP